jgi:hypothetical protein
MTVMAVNLSLISSGLIRLLLGRMTGLSELKIGAGIRSSEQGAWSTKTKVRDCSVAN